MTGYSGKNNAKNLEGFLQLRPENSATNTPSIIGTVAVGCLAGIPNVSVLASDFSSSRSSVP